MMTIRNAKKMTIVVPLLAVLVGTTGMALAGAAKDPLRCELKITRSTGSVTLEALASADRSVDGTYQLHVEGSGSSRSSIQQGGRFSAGPGSASSLGTVSLNTRGAIYDATLEITAGGKSATCLETIGSRI